MRWWILATVFVAVIVRMLVCLGSFFLAGPLLGLVSLPLWEVFDAPAPVFELLATLAAVLAGLVIAVQVAGGQPDPVRRARRLGIVVIADTVFYLASFVVGFKVLDMEESFDATFAFIVVTNVAVLLGGIVIVRQAKTVVPQL
ncbi:hypothetical protein [Paractinoplanes lichenicola]|uniref:Uncharacterized protein n=1 Tax=Paractinoplanes lichenicola TaxID=2802976 RepID=A0ABS1VU43_9ACTN|nr:hypothetical protein [Actinoplanes lichenicola]MBL7257953.1 hypothetical protein [Actinoplanes lichenicola]